MPRFCRGAPADRTEGTSADAAAAPSLDEATVKAMRHALLDAYDRADEADEKSVAGALGPAFVLPDERGSLLPSELSVGTARASQRVGWLSDSLAVQRVVRLSEA